MKSTNAATIEWTLKRHRQSTLPTGETGQPDGPQIPRISRLMALAIKCDDLIRQGIVDGYSDLARLGCVSRARVTQIMNLLNLAPAIQAEILYFTTESEQALYIVERKLRRLTSLVDWCDQKQKWHDTKKQVVEARQSRRKPNRHEAL